MVFEAIGDIPEAVHAIARPIRGETELDEMVEVIAHKRLVLLGEATHGTHEFYDLRAAITRRLITKHGFAAVVVEGDWPDALRVDHFVRDQASDDEASDRALAGFERFPRWMWRNTDVNAFVEWLAGHNRTLAPEQRVGFYGMDLYSMHTSLHAVLQYLGENDRDAAARARAHYACFDHAAGDPRQYGLQASIGLGPRCENEVVAVLADMQRRKAARSGRTPGGDSWFQAMQQANVVHNAEAYYRAMFAGRTASWNLRDTHMADTVDFVAKHLGKDGEPEKLVVWAHNSHVGDARATDMGDDGQLTLGQLVRQRHPNEAALVGFTTYDGSVVAAHDWEQPAERTRVRPALAGSWEQLFHDVAMPRFYMTTAAMKRVIGIDVERLERAIGVVYRPLTERMSHYFQARIAQQFDVVVHVDSTRGVEPLDPFDEPDSPATHTDLPETYPTGV